jgi:hypothetical protein
MLRSRIVFGLSIAAALAVVACGSSDGSLFDGQTSDGKNSGGPNNGDGTFSDGPTSTNDACVSSTMGAQLTPVNLVFMYDKSGSMGDTSNSATFDPNLKWIPVGTGMKSFFADPQSSTMSASLQFFPLGGDLNEVCAAPYNTPKVALSPLTNTTPFVQAIDSTQPNGGTPTLPALNGALEYAKGIAQQRPSEKTVVVLVTDGEPGFGINGQFVPGCPNNDIAHVAALAKSYYQGSPSVPTYVIGVGPALNNLNTIAAAGGTKQAYMVSVGDPNATKSTFLTALGSIRQLEMACDFALPPPPAGKELNEEGVNVVYKDASGQETVLSYNSDCQGGAGWHYDNLASPSRVMLCPNSCNQARSDGLGKLTLAFGCITKGVVR